MILTCKPSTRLHRRRRSVIRRSLKTEEISRQTERRFANFKSENETGGAGGQTTFAALQRADKLWTALKTSQLTDGVDESFISDHAAPIDFIDYDLVVCGGTLGIFLACTLQMRGLRVAVIERGDLRGRQQEWNISRKELQDLIEAGILTDEELESCISSEWEKVRAGFYGGHEIWTTGILNIGISPAALIEKVRLKFEKEGGVVLQRSPISSIKLHNNGMSLRLDSKETPSVSTRLLIDCMGHFSPIVRQSRRGQRPDGVCLVVGTCGRGFQENEFSDLIKTNGPIVQAYGTGSKVQYFWEAFPAGSGPTDRTTYMFAYVDATPARPSLEDMFEDYWRLMPEYQAIDLDSIEFKRALFGFFPTFKDAPLRPTFDRVVHVGDAGGLQSPLSFGGFGAMLRHLKRHTDAIESALNANVVDKQSLSLINPYNPGLSATWMFQKVMCATEETPEMMINEILSSNFSVMESLGPKVLKPFLQDVTKFGPLTITLLVQALTNPVFIYKVTKVLGAGTLLDWLPHFVKLGSYEVASLAAGPMRGLSKELPPRDMYKIQRYADALVYGSGADYKF